MDNDIYKKIILGDFKVSAENRYIIFGTGDVADIYFDHIKQSAGEEAVCFFINEKENIEFYQNKSVIKCSEIGSEYKTRQYIYILATVSKIPLFIEKLKSIGVHNEQIWFSTHIFSVDYFMNDNYKIRRVILYPPFKTEDEFERLNREFDLYSTVKNSEVEHIFLMEKELIVNSFFSKMIIKDYKYKEGDLLWIWCADNSIDEYLIGKKAICCDDSFLFQSVEKMHMALNNKLLKKDYADVSIDNWEKLCEDSKRYKYATVCGMGPSLMKMNANTRKFIKEGFIIVCNYFFKKKEILHPNVYVIHDSSFVSEEMKQDLAEIIEYVVKEKIFLVVDNRWINTILKRHPEAINYIIGLQSEGAMCIPNQDSLVYYSQDNVIPALGLPVAAGLYDDIYIIGCDGHNSNGDWEHADGQIFAKDEFSEKQFLNSNNVKNNLEYEKKETDMFEKVFAYNKQKKYKLLANSTYVRCDKMEL